MVFFFTVIPWLTHGRHLKRPTLWGFLSYLAGQVLLVLIPAGSGGPGWSTYALLGACLLLDAFGASILFMLAESLVALHVDRDERSRVMAIQRTVVMLVTAPFGWISGLLSGVDRTWPFILTSALARARHRRHVAVLGHHPYRSRRRRGLSSHSDQRTVWLIASSTSDWRHGRTTRATSSPSERKTSVGHSFTR